MALVPKVYCCCFGLGFKLVHIPQNPFGIPRGLQTARTQTRREGEKQRKVKKKQVTDSSSAGEDDKNEQ